MKAPKGLKLRFGPMAAAEATRAAKVPAAVHVGWELPRRMTP